MLGFVLIGAQDCWDQEPALEQRAWKLVASRWRQSSRARIRPPASALRDLPSFLGGGGEQRSQRVAQGHTL